MGLETIPYGRIEGMGDDSRTDHTPPKGDVEFKKHARDGKLGDSELLLDYHFAHVDPVAKHIAVVEQ